MLRRFTTAWNTASMIDRGLMAMGSAAVLIGACDILLRLWFELWVPYDGDASYFITIGRGMLSGLVPYRDLFETKAPGMYLISAFSLLVTKNMAAAHVTQAAAILVIPAAFVVAARRERAGWMPLLTAFLLGCVMALYAALHAGEFYPESFGAVALCAYVVLLAGPGIRGPYGIAAAALCLLMAIGIKETFLPAALGIALLLIGTPKNSVRQFLVPLLLAALTGILVLWALGHLEPYVTIYLPFMREYRSNSSTTDPLWLRGLFWDLTWKNLTEFSFPLGTLFFGMWIAAWAAWRDPRTRNGLIAVCLLPFPLLALAYAATFPGENRAVLAGVLLLYVVLLPLLASRGCTSIERRERIWQGYALIAGLYLLLLSAGAAGEFFGHHFVHLVPGFLAVFLLILRMPQERVRAALVPVILCIACIMTVLHVRIDLSGRLLERQIAEAQQKRQAAAVDAALDGCGWGRYLNVMIGTHYFSHTRHSPYGPGFMQIKWNRDIPYFHDTFLANAKRAELIVLPSAGAEVAADAREYIEENFTTDIPACAKDAVVPDDILLLFRK